MTPTYTCKQFAYDGGWISFDSIPAVANWARFNDLRYAEIEPQGVCTLFVCLRSDGSALSAVEAHNLKTLIQPASLPSRCWRVEKDVEANRELARVPDGVKEIWIWRGQEAQ